RLWATRRVGFLLDQIRLHGENSELREEATELARKYGIVTPFTAYLILEDETKREVPVALQSLPQLLEDRDARKLTERAWNGFNRKDSGGEAVAGARYGLALKSALAARDAVTLGNVEAQRSLTYNEPAQSVNSLAGAPSPTARIDQYTQQSRFVG